MSLRSRKNNKRKSALHHRPVRKAHLIPAHGKALKLQLVGKGNSQHIMGNDGVQYTLEEARELLTTRAADTNCPYLINLLKI